MSGSHVPSNSTSPPRAPWQQAFGGAPLVPATSYGSSSSVPNTAAVPSSATSLYRQKLQASAPMSAPSPFSNPSRSPAHVMGGFASPPHPLSGSPGFHQSQTGYPAYGSVARQNSGGYSSPALRFEPQGSASPYNHHQSHLSQSSGGPRPPISLLTTQPTPLPDQNHFPIAIPNSSSLSASNLAYLAAGATLDPTSVVYDENSGGYATPSYAGSFADDSSFDERRSPSPFSSRAAGNSLDPSPDLRFNRDKTSFSQSSGMFGSINDLLAFRETHRPGREWDEASSNAGYDDARGISLAPGAGSVDASPAIGTADQSLEGHGLEMGVERMFAPIPSPKLLPLGREDTARADPPSARQRSESFQVRVTDAAVITASPSQSPRLTPAGDLPMPKLARHSPSPTSGGFRPETTRQPSLKSPPLPHGLQQSESKMNTLAPLSIPDGPELTLTSATPTAVPRTATMRQDSTQAALDTVFSTFFERKDSRKESTDSMPNTDLGPEAQRALFNVPAHNLTLDLGAAESGRRPAMRQRSKSDTYMNSPLSYDPSVGLPYGGYGPPSAFGMAEDGPSIDPRNLGSNQGNIAVPQASMNTSLMQDEHTMFDNYRSSEAGPAARRRSMVQHAPYDAYSGPGTIAHLVHQISPQYPDYLQPPSPMRRTRSQGHRRAAQSEDYTSSTFTPRGEHFTGYDNIAPQSLSQYGDIPLPPLPEAQHQYSLPPLPMPGDMAGYQGSNLDMHNFPYSSVPGYPDYVNSGPLGYGNAGYGGAPVIYAPLEEDNTNLGVEPQGGRGRRRSSVNSNASGFSHSGSEITYESKTTEATKQAARRRRKDPNAAKFMCEYCGETFTRAYNLKGHIRSHEGSKPFVCATCDKGFARRHDLKRHELLHTGVKKYMCQACHTPFVRLDALQRHHKSENGAACVAQIQEMAEARGMTFEEIERAFDLGSRDMGPTGVEL